MATNSPAWSVNEQASKVAELVATKIVQDAFWILAQTVSASGGDVDKDTSARFLQRMADAARYLQLYESAICGDSQFPSLPSTWSQVGESERKRVRQLLEGAVEAAIGVVFSNAGTANENQVWADLSIKIAGFRVTYKKAVELIALD